MSAIITTTVQCDECGVYHRAGEDNHLTATEQRDNAGKDGWIRIVSKDYCPTCTARLFPDRRKRGPYKKH